MLIRKFLKVTHSRIFETENATNQETFTFTFNIIVLLLSSQAKYLNGIFCNLIICFEKLF